MKKTKKKYKKKQKSKKKYKGGASAEKRPLEESLEEKIASGKIASFGRTQLIADINGYENKEIQIDIESEFNGVKLLLILSKKFNEKYKNEHNITIKIPELLCDSLIDISNDVVRNNISSFSSDNIPESVYKYDYSESENVRGYLMEYINQINHCPIEVNPLNKSIYNKILKKFIKFCHHNKVFHGDLAVNYVYDEENKRIIIFDPINSSINNEEEKLEENYFTRLEEEFDSGRIEIPKYPRPIFKQEYLNSLNDNYTKKSSLFENKKFLNRIKN